MEKIKSFLKEINIKLAIQVSLGAFLAILIADLMGVKYGPTAGITTLLTIQGSKKETINVSIKRFNAFILMVVISYILFNILGYQVYSYGIFILFYYILASLLGLQVGIISNAVLATHFLIEKNMGWAMIFNEFLILFIGVSIGVAINLIMPVESFDPRKKQEKIDYELAYIVSLIGYRLRGTYYFGRESEYGDRNQKFIEKKISDLDKYIKEVSDKLLLQSNNKLFYNHQYFYSYFQMRLSQLGIIKIIWENILLLDMHVLQSIPLSKLFHLISKSFDERDNVEELNDLAKKTLEHYRYDQLPKDRKEFENRAIMYSILNEVFTFINLKKDFVDQLDEEEKKYYWN